MSHAFRCAKHYQDVTVIAHGERKKAVEQNGLMLHSEYKGNIHAVPAAVLEPYSPMPVQDYVFFCVKNYSLDVAMAEMEAYINENTILIPVMNGVDPGARIRCRLPLGTVVDSLIYIVSYSLSDTSIVQEGQFAKIHLGIINAASTGIPAVSKAATLLSDADIDCTIAEDIEAEIWKKFILNCAYNVLTTYYNEPIGKLRSDEKKAGEYETLVREAYQIALAKGVHVTDSDIAAILHRFYHELAYDATSSLQRDYQSGKKTELETFSGYLVKESVKFGIDLPLTRTLYEKLLQKI